MKHLVAAVLAISLFAIACGSDTSGDLGTPTLPPDTDQVVLTIGFEGGFAPIEALYYPLPLFVLLGDGRLISQGPVAEIYPGPVMPNLQVAQLNDDEAAELLRLVDEIGLPSTTDERDDNTDDAGFIADAPDTVFRYHDDNGEHRFAVYALGASLEPTDPRLVASQQLVDTAANLAVTAEQLGPYVVERLHITISDGSFLVDEELSTVVPWPLDRPSSDFEPLVLELRCSVFEGEEATQAVRALNAANQLTLWDDISGLHRPIPRPLFPGEAGCPTP